MLTLSRWKGEVIVIGDGPDRVEVMVIDIRGDKVRLGIAAPSHVPVHRLEIYERIQREKGSA